jgi:hypothetical protein
LAGIGKLPALAGGIFDMVCTVFFVLQDLAGAPFCEILRELTSKGGLGPSKRGQKQAKKGFPPNVRYPKVLTSLKL